MTTTAKFEKSVRHYVHKALKAYFARVDGEWQVSVSKNSARAIIVNPRKVAEVLTQSFGKPVEIKGDTATFKVAKRGSISLTARGANSVLTLRSVH